MVNPQKCSLFFGPKISVLGRKIRFLPYDPNFGQQTDCSARRDRSFPTFPFPSYGRSRKKKTDYASKSRAPPPVRAPSARNSPRALSAQARRAGKKPKPIQICNLFIFLTCKSKYKNQRKCWIYFEKSYNLLHFFLMFHLNVQLTKSIMFVVWQKPFHDKTHGRYFL